MPNITVKPQARQQSSSAQQADSKTSKKPEQSATQTKNKPAQTQKLRLYKFKLPELFQLWKPKNHTTEDNKPKRSQKLRREPVGSYEEDTHEKPDNTFVAKKQNRRKTIEELNIPSFLERRKQDVIDVIKESKRGIGPAIQTAINGISKSFSKSKEFATDSMTIRVPQISSSYTNPFVLDTDFENEDRSSKDTTSWNNDPIDRSGNKYYLPESFRITLDMKFGSRNRGQYYDLNSNNAPITTYKPFYSYDENPIPYEDSERHLNHFIGYDKNGTFKLGPLDKFLPGDTLSQIFYKDIVNIPRDNTGQLIYNVASTDPSRFWPMVDAYGESYYNDKDSLLKGVFDRVPITVLTGKKGKDANKYGRIDGGRVLLLVGDEVRLVSGTVNQIVNEIQAIMRNHKGKPVRYYELDNGSYNRALRTKNSNITALDLLDYDRQNTWSARGGHLMYIKNNDKK